MHVHKDMNSYYIFKGSDNDGCSKLYLIITNSNRCNTSIVAKVWGDGFNTAGEQWDDRNTTDGDGWSSIWNQESGWTWSGGSATTKDTCKEAWGDGKRFNSNSTYWDDYNTNNGDGCSSIWTIETGWSWSGGNKNSKDTWHEIWGDGNRFNSNSTYWDDGNTYNGDGCSSTCKVENGYSCTEGSSSAKDIWNDIWGDGKRFSSIVYQN